MKKQNKNIFKRIGRFCGKYINGTRGAVSIFLALVMSPLLSISLILVESARYQDAVQLMNEIIDSSVFSTLAEYDPYLDKRFGLLSVSQGLNINSTFSDYLGTNTSAIGKSVVVNSQKATGAFSLAETEVLKQQMLEYGEISIAAEVAAEGLDLDGLLKKLKKQLDLSDIEDEIEAVTAGVDLASEVEKILEAIDDAKKQYKDKYSPALTDYKDRYDDFSSDATALINALEDAEDALEDDESQSSVYDDKDVKDAIKNLKNSRDKYKKAAEELKTEFSTLKGYIETIISSADTLPSKLNEVSTEVTNSTVAGECTTSAYEWIEIVADQITTTFETTVGDSFQDVADSEIAALTAQITSLGNIGDKTITSSWTSSEVREKYGPLKITSVGDSFYNLMDKLITRLNEHAQVGTKGSAAMGSLLDIVGELLGISGLYDGNLNSVLSKSCLHTSTKMSLSAQMSMASLTDLIDACDTFVEGITSFDIIKAVKALCTLLKAVAEFLAAIVAWVAETLWNLVSFVASGPKEWYNSLLLYGYGAYNLPNRTNYNSGKTISGFSYGDIYKMAGGKNSEPKITGSLKQLSTIGNTTGTDKMFKGAEAEYVLIGSNSELQNQSIAFFDLYLFRLVLDLIPILRNKEVTALSAAAGPGAWVVKLAIALAEPMLDCIILVNGGKEFFFKETVYFSFSGFVILQNDLVGITSISKNLQDKIKDTIEEHNGTPTEKGLFDASYTEHLLILMLLSVNQTEYFNRMKNLIQMESAVKNEGQFVFKLDKAYTYVKTDVKYTLNPMFNIDSLTKNGLFTATSKRYSGY